MIAAQNIVTELPREIGGRVAYTYRRIVDFETAREALILERSLRSERGGYHVNGLWFQSDHTANTDQMGLYMLGENMPEGIIWTAMDGQLVEMTPELARAIFATAAGKKLAMSEAFNAKLAEAQGLEDFAGFDHTAGWPLCFFDGR